MLFTLIRTYQAQEQNSRPKAEVNRKIKQNCIHLRVFYSKYSSLKELYAFYIFGTLGKQKIVCLLNHSEYISLMQKFSKYYPKTRAEKRRRKKKHWKINISIKPCLSSDFKQFLLKSRIIPWCTCLCLYSYHKIMNESASYRKCTHTVQKIQINTTLEM